MAKRFVSIWFRYLVTDWFTLKSPQLGRKAFVLSAPSHGRMIVTGTNALAEAEGIYTGMVLADARAIFPGLEVLDDKPGLAEKLLKRIASWCIRFTPITAMDLPDSIVLDATGCAHLWGGEPAYLAAIVDRLKGLGFKVAAAMADTIGTAWGISRFGKPFQVIPGGEQKEALLDLPPAALRLEADTIERLHQLGLRQVKDFLHMPSSALNRRFGDLVTTRLNQALGLEDEILQPVEPLPMYQERLPCLEPIVSATGIQIALQRLLEALSNRLHQEQKGLRTAVFKAFRVDGKIEQVDIATSRPSSNVRHLFHLFEIKLQTIEPALGIELFVLEAPSVEDHVATQVNLWESGGGLDDIRISELIDRLTIKIGEGAIHRYLPDEHYWPERSIKHATSLQEKAVLAWRIDRPRPIQLLPFPEKIEVTAPVPDYPPMLFRYKGNLHTIKKADGPERIEQEWWIEEGQHRDYYAVEDEAGRRYWLFRSGHYDEEKSVQWFIHGFFA